LVRDADGSAFLSRASADELAALARDRAVAWSTRPPTDAPALLSREDQYRTAALWHIQSRNEAWARGDVRTAWRENLILERYFAPVLDLGHRWAGAQRADAETRGGANLGGSY